MNIIDSLLLDHTHLREHLTQIKEADKKNKSGFHLAFSQFKDLLHRHTFEEEMFLYRQVALNEEMRPETLEGHEEHKLMDQLLQEMESLKEESELWDAKFEVIQDLLKHHLKEEEEDLFVTAEKVVPQSDLERWGEQALETRQTKAS